MSDFKKKTVFIFWINIFDFENDFLIIIMWLLPLFSHLWCHETYFNCVIFYLTSELASCKRGFVFSIEESQAIVASIGMNFYKFEYVMKLTVLFLFSKLGTYLSHCHANQLSTLCRRGRRRFSMKQSAVW